MDDMSDREFLEDIATDIRLQGRDADYQRLSRLINRMAGQCGPIGGVFSGKSSFDMKRDESGVIKTIDLKYPS